MTFEHLKIGDRIHILESTGTFKKTTMYNLGYVHNVSLPYDEPTPPQQYPIPNQIKKRLIDITISCDGESKKLTVSPEKDIITDSTIGLTVATDKNAIVNMVKISYNDYKAKREALSKYDEEISRCEDILKQLEVSKEDLNKPIQIDSSAEITALRNELGDLKSFIKQMTDNPMVKQFIGNQSIPKPNLPAVQLSKG